MESVARSLGALGTNPALGVDKALSVHGSDWLWAVTAFYILVFLILLTFCFTMPEADRVFHYLFTITLLVGSVSYFAQAADLGWSAVAVAGDDTVTRQVSWAKYANWAVAFPAAALALGLLSGVSWTTILTNVFTCLLWVATYLVGAYTASVYKWGFFAFGTLCWVILAMSTLNESREAAQRMGIGRDYILLAALVNAAWFLYPIAWALGDGSNTAGVTGSFIFTGIVDMLQLPVFACAFVLTARKWDFASLNLDVSESRRGWQSQRPHEAGGKAGADVACVSHNAGAVAEAV